VKLATAEEIAAETQIPLPYLSKLLKHLADAELIKSFKGRKGGYQLRRAATELTMGEIMGALGEKTPSQFCVLTPSRCG
jgi:Rrf2 family protein